MPEEDADFIMEEFEWALKDPTEEKLKSLGEVVSTITTKLVEAIADLQNQVIEIQTSLKGFETKINQMEGQIARGVSASPSAAASASPAADAAPAMAKAPIAKAPAPRAPSGPGGMMGELKALLAARRKKAEGGGE
jgi:hypothetical protein